MSVRASVVAVASLAIASVALACGSRKENPGARIAAVEAALAKGDTTAAIAVVGDAPACAPGEANPKAACLDRVATRLGSRLAFRTDPVDQAACATAAIVLVREKAGDLLPELDPFLSQLKNARGPGVDALRLAVAEAMAGSASAVGTKVETDRDVTALAAAITGAIPGACATYGAIGRGAALAKLPPDVHPDHAACVHKDLGRREGPGPRYGAGMLRAAEGAAAAWRETERALRVGLDHASPGARERVTAKLVLIEAATARLSIKKVDAPQTPQDVLSTLSDVHTDAGVALFKPDGGAGERPKAPPRNPAGPR